MGSRITKSSISVLVIGLSVFTAISGVAFGSELRPPKTEMIEAEKGNRTIVTRRDLAVFRFRSDTGVRFECSLDAAPWRGCRRGVFRRYVGPGSHRFRVRAVDPGGTVDPTPAFRRWAVDRWEPGLRAARRYAAKRIGRVSFSVDVGWRTWGRTARVRAPMASTVKAMLMVAYLRRPKVRNRRLSGYEKSLISPMIRISDNGSANVVASIVGPSGMRALARRARLRDFDYSTVWGLSRTNAFDQARFMRAVPRLIPDRHRAWAMRLLSRIDSSQRWGIPKVRPRGWRLFFKGGWGISDGRFGGTVNHQIALLERNGLRIGLAILTQGNPWTGYGEKTLKGVASRLLSRLPLVRGG